MRSARLEVNQIMQFANTAALSGATKDCIDCPREREQVTGLLRPALNRSFFTSFPLPSNSLVDPPRSLPLASRCFCRNE